MVKNESPLVFATQSLDAFEVGEEFTEWLEVTGGTPSYSFAVIGGTLPPGIEVTPLGTVNGVPSEAGSFKFAVEAMRPDDVELPRQRPGPLHRHTNAVGGRRARLSGKRDHDRKRKTQRAKHVQTMP